MQRLATTLNKLTSPIAHRVAFEAVDTQKMFETWKDESALNVILGGKLKVILC